MKPAVSQTATVLIVGAGPVGLTLACELRRRGVACHIIDQQAGAATTSRALGVFNRTLEVFDQMGLAQDIVARGQPAREMTIYAAGKRLAAFQFAVDAYETPFPNPLFCSQVAVEQTLTQHLARFGTQPEWGTTLLALTQVEHGITATVRLHDGSEQIVNARWLVGCDGGHSQVRKLLHLPFEGAADETWMVVDVELDWRLPKHSLYAFLAHEGTVVAFPFPEGRRWRLLETVVGQQTDSASVAARFTQKINQVYHDEPITVPEPLWMSTFTIQQRHVPTMRIGRCFVAGDAAHVHSPASGQGMNTGIQDAFNLAWKLALVEQGQGTEAILDSYSVEREAVARQVLAGALTFTRIVGRNTPLREVARNALLRFANGIPPLHRRVNQRITRMLSELGIAYESSPIITEAWHPLAVHADMTEGIAAGQRLPDIPFGAGKADHLFDLTRGTSHSILVLAGLTPTAEEIATTRQIVDFLRDYQSYHPLQWWLIAASADVRHAVQSFGRERFDMDGHLHRRLGAAQPTVYMIRPDGYVGYRAQPAQVQRLRDYLVTIFTTAKVGP